MKNFLFFRFILIFIASTSMAQSIEIKDLLNENIESKVKILKVKKGDSLGIDQVLSKKAAFQNFDKSQIIADTSKTWIKFSLNNSTDKSNTVFILTDRFQYLNFWMVRDSTLTGPLKSGMALPANERNIENQAYSGFKVTLEKNESVDVYLLAINKNPRNQMMRYRLPLSIVSEKEYRRAFEQSDSFTYIYLGATFLLIFFVVILLILTQQRAYLWFLGYIIFNALFLIGISPLFGYQYFGNTEIQGSPALIFGQLASIFQILFTLNILAVKKHNALIYKILLVILGVNFFTILATYIDVLPEFRMMISSLAFIIHYPAILIYCVLMARKKHLPSIMMLISIILYVIGAYVSGFQYYEVLPTYIWGMTPIRISQISCLIGDSFFALILGLKINEERNLRLAQEKEKRELLYKQKDKLEKMVGLRTEELQESIKNLKDTQKQLVQSEKLASLGELTAGIAHEIQNPLNFVNNFAEVSSEMITEMMEDIEAGKMESAEEIAQSLKGNLEKINHHGKRASSIVKGMLEHSRTSNGIKEPTDINAIADEFLRLSYHGLRAKDKTFNSDFKIDIDPDLPKINAVGQDMGRVFLNLINNSFYACNVRSRISKDKNEPYKPLVVVSTKKTKNNIEISIKDNGTGIPEENLSKIFQPFFTTKPTGKGTGLGLSLSYDIVTKGHGGTLEVESEVGIGTTFKVKLPFS